MVWPFSWQLKPIIVGILAVGLWAYFGFSSPTTLLYWATAEQECVKFAEKNKEKLFFSSGQNIKAVSSWLKHGKVVVEIGAFNNNEDSYTPRICVVGGGTIQIVSILESGVWR